MRILHDVDARNDEKIRRLLHRHGTWGYGAFWMVVEFLFKNNGRMNMTGDFFYPLLADELATEEAEARSFIGHCLDIGLFRVDVDDKGEECLISDRCIRDIEAYRSRTSKARDSAHTRWNRVAAGEKIANTFTHFLEMGRVTRQVFADELQAIGLVDEQIERLWKLSKEFSKHALGHYTRAAAAHLRANGSGKTDFVAYVEKWLLEDAAAGKGFFALNKLPTQKHGNVRHTN